MYALHRRQSQKTRVYRRLRKRYKFTALSKHNRTFVSHGHASSESTFRNPVPHPSVRLHLANRSHVRHRRTDLLHLGGNKVRHPRRLCGISPHASDSLVSARQRAEELEKLDGRLRRTRFGTLAAVDKAYASTHDLHQIIFRSVLPLLLQQRKPVPEWNDRKDIATERLSLND